MIILLGAIRALWWVSSAFKERKRLKIGSQVSRLQQPTNLSAAQTIKLNNLFHYFVSQCSEITLRSSQQIKVTISLGFSTDNKQRFIQEKGISSLQTTGFKRRNKKLQI